mmetsp:Transcript_18494/g.19259  ORF Transcript_18494/g.19259 Transcript_18494/m.19259 type:complete len:355 (+) Transcript_18494:66-1130(+)
MSSFINNNSTKGQTALTAIDEKGAFKRTASIYRDFISNDHPIYKPEANRYHLYISLACPWANGAYTVLKLKGLDSIIGVSITHYTWQRTRPDDDSDKHCGWVFRDSNDPPLVAPSGFGSFPGNGCIPDSINGAKTVRDLYDLVGDNGSRYTVPVLWDKHTKTIVNNESIEIFKIFNTAFNDLLPEDSPGRKLDLFPSHLVPAIDEAYTWIYPQINNGVYRAGFAQSQQAYDEAVNEVFQALDRVESILTNSRYICSNEFTAIDIRLFMTLIRFDEVYVVYFKCNKRFLSSYPQITNYLRELYQHPVIHDVINMEHIKGHYFSSHSTLNAYSVIPVGPNTLEFLSLPHDRNRFEV